MTSGWTVASDQDWVSRTGFNLTLETTKDSTKYIYERMAFKTKDIKQQKTETPWEMGYKWGEPCNFPAINLRECPGSDAGKANLGRACCSPWVEEVQLRIQRPRRHKFKGHSTRQKTAEQRENSGDPERVCREYSAGYWSTNTCEENTKGQAKTTWKD